MIICLSFIAIPLITVSLCLIGQYPPGVGSKSSLFCGHPLIMYVGSICSSSSILIAFLISPIDVQTRTSIDMLSVCMLMLTPASPGLYSQCDSDGIAIPLVTDLIQACIICTCCIDEYAALCIVATVTGL